MLKNDSLTKHGSSGAGPGVYPCIVRACINAYVQAVLHGSSSGSSISGILYRLSVGFCSLDNVLLSVEFRVF